MPLIASPFTLPTISSAPFVEMFLLFRRVGFEITPMFLVKGVFKELIPRIESWRSPLPSAALDFPATCIGRKSNTAEVNNGCPSRGQRELPLETQSSMQFLCSYKRNIFHSATYNMIMLLVAITNLCQVM